MGPRDKEWKNENETKKMSFSMKKVFFKLFFHCRVSGISRLRLFWTKTINNSYIFINFIYDELQRSTLYLILKLKRQARIKGYSTVSNVLEHSISKDFVPFRRKAKNSFLIPPKRINH